MKIAYNFKASITVLPVVIYVYAIIVSQLLMSNEQLSIFIQLAIGMVCFFIAVVQYKTQISKLWISISVLFSVLLIFSLLYNSNSRLYHVLYIWGRVGGALLFSFCGIKEKTMRMVFYSVSAIFLLMALTGVGANDVLLGASRNGINGIIIFYAICCYILHEESEDKALPYSYAIVAFVISLWSEGRSGVIVTVLMIAFVAIYNFMIVKKGKIRTLFIFAILIGVAYWFSISYFSHYIFDIQDRFESRGLGSLRYNVWAEYLDSLKSSFLNILFGSPTVESSYYLMHLYSGNLHNAFLMLHSKFGLIGFVLVIFSIIKSAFVFVRSKRVCYFFALMIIVARGLFDWVAFPGYYDFLFVLLFTHMWDEQYKLKYSH